MQVAEAAAVTGYITDDTCAGVQSILYVDRQHASLPTITIHVLHHAGMPLAFWTAFSWEYYSGSASIPSKKMHADR